MDCGPAREYEKPGQFATRSTTALAFNVLVVFRVIAVSGAALTLIPTPATAIVPGFAICAAGILFVDSHGEHWIVLANICCLRAGLSRSKRFCRFPLTCCRRVRFWPIVDGQACRGNRRFFGLAMTDQDGAGAANSLYSALRC